MTAQPPPRSPEFDDLVNRNEKQRGRFAARQPKKINNVMAQLFARRGYAARQSSEHLAGVWQKAAGETLAKYSRAVSIRRGRLEVIVANSLMLQEIDFQRDEILAGLAAELPDNKITDLHLRVGTLPE